MPEGTKCIHHWVIEPAKRATSRGVCRKCGKERDDFENSSSTDLTWEHRFGPVRAANLDLPLGAVFVY